MGVSMSGLGRSVGRLRTESVRLGELGRELTEEAAERGAERMREIIATSATPWVRENLHREGRIETEDMYKAVKAGDARKLQRGWSASFGWLDVQKAYFRMQEEGTYNVPNPTPMFALLGAYVETQEWFRARVREELRNR